MTFLFQSWNTSTWNNSMNVNWRNEVKSSLIYLLLCLMSDSGVTRCDVEEIFWNEVSTAAALHNSVTNMLHKRNVAKILSIYNKIKYCLYNIYLRHWRICWHLQHIVIQRNTVDVQYHTCDSVLVSELSHIASLFFTDMTVWRQQEGPEHAGIYLKNEAWVYAVSRTVNKAVYRSSQTGVCIIQTLNICSASNDFVFSQIKATWYSTQQVKSSFNLVQKLYVISWLYNR